MLLAAAPAQSSVLSRLAHTLTATHAGEETLGDGFIEALPVLLGNEDPSKHGDRKVTAGRGARDQLLRAMEMKFWNLCEPSRLVM